MAAETLAQLQAELAQVQQAISDVLQYGQSNQEGDSVYRRADLVQLRAHRAELVSRINAQTSAHRMDRTVAAF
ncbi:MAG: hypothetical protein LLF76_03085 [Planctomycetaceae bacterium]|nr:hypothetical protein [Planctomycetaceae bacterium]